MRRFCLRVQVRASDDGSCRRPDGRTTRYIGACTCHPQYRSKCLKFREERPGLRKPKFKRSSPILARFFSCFKGKSGLEMPAAGFNLQAGKAPKPDGMGWKNGPIPELANGSGGAPWRPQMRTKKDCAIFSSCNRQSVNIYFFMVLNILLSVCIFGLRFLRLFFSTLHLKELISWHFLMISGLFSYV